MSRDTGLRLILATLILVAASLASVPRSTAKASGVPVSVPPLWSGALTTIDALRASAPTPSSRVASAPSHAEAVGAIRPPRLTSPRAAAGVTAGGARSLFGLASWYCRPGRSACTRGYAATCACAAAGAALRAFLGPRWRTTRVRVSAGTRAVWVRLIDCLCSGRNVIDLYSGIFAQLAPLGAGLVRVRVERR